MDALAYALDFVLGERGRGVKEQAWLEVRAELPVEEWFWGLSYTELRQVAPLMKRAEAEWDDDSLQAVRTLGTRAFPYLLDKLLDDEFALSGLRYCDQANALLHKLTGVDLGQIESTELLTLDPQDPRRKHRLVILKNRVSMSLIQRRWTQVLLAL